MGRRRRMGVVGVIMVIIRHFTSTRRRIDRWRRRWVVGVIMVILRHFTSVHRWMGRWRRRWVMVVIVMTVPGCFTAVLRWMIVLMARSRVIVMSVPAIVLGLRCWKGFRVTRRV